MMQGKQGEESAKDRSDIRFALPELPAVFQ